MLMLFFYNIKSQIATSSIPKLSVKKVSTPITLEKQKNEYVETLRGIAIILVVLGHIIGSTKLASMQVKDDSFLRFFYYSLEYIRMPLFTVISGWVYANKPIVNKGDWPKFIKGKMRRLLIPMFVLSALMFLMRVIVPGTNLTPNLDRIHLILFFPYDLYWYIYSLFIIFLFIIVIDTKAWFHQFHYWLFMVGVAACVSYASHRFLDSVPNLFSFKGALFLLPYFLLGIGFFRYRHIILTKEHVLLVATTFIIGFGFQQFIWFSGMPHLSKGSALGFVVGASATFLLFKFKFKNDFLKKIGGYAYSIYLFHLFFTGGARIALHSIGIHNHFAILTLSLFAAIVGSIILEKLIMHSKPLRWFLLGLK